MGKDLFEFSERERSATQMMIDLCATHTMECQLCLILWVQHAHLLLTLWTQHFYRVSRELISPRISSSLVSHTSIKNLHFQRLSLRFRVKTSTLGQSSVIHSSQVVRINSRFYFICFSAYFGEVFCDINPHKKHVPAHCVDFQRCKPSATWPADAVSIWSRICNQLEGQQCKFSYCTQPPPLPGLSPLSPSPMTTTASVSRHFVTHSQRLY